MERLTKIKGECKLSGCNFAIFFIDLDNFKHINDTCGHSAGDVILQSVASRIANSVRRSDLVARFGGDEFVVVVPNLSQGSLAIDTVQTLATKICDAVASPYLHEAREIRISCSIGIHVGCHTEETLDRALLGADAAMYLAKSSGRNRWAISSNTSVDPLMTLSSAIF